MLKNILKYFFVISLAVLTGLGLYKLGLQKFQYDPIRYDITESPNLDETKSQKNNHGEGRSAKVNIDYDSLLKNTIEEEIYKDVQFYSTLDRKFTTEEINLIKAVIDSMPEKLFDYRPWGIISTAISDDIPTDLPENYGIAYSGGPFVFVGDKTFAKDNSSDNGTFRGLQRILSHEFVHIAQFFETYTSSDSNKITLDSSLLTQSWIKEMNWKKEEDVWILPEDSITTTYGKTNPTEDMADAVGLMTIGDKSSLSPERINWVLNWLEMNETAVLKGKLPLFQNLNQIKLEEADQSVLEKYKDVRSIRQDLLKFQYVAEIDRDEFIDIYTGELISRGWASGSIQPNGFGEFSYGDRYKIHLEIDESVYPVIIIVMTVIG